MLNEVLNINKPVGITSYDVIRQLKREYPSEKIGHAGTLDPLANGVLICLVGKLATKRQSEYMHLGKEYLFTILFGFETDTYDVLGLVKDMHDYDPKVIAEQLRKSLSDYKGNIEQKVPPFSAVKVNGRPLYRWYLDGKIDEVKVPVKIVRVEEIELVDTSIVTSDEVHKEINGLVKQVKSGFRQKDVVKGWQKVFEGNPPEKLLKATIQTEVSKGTYVRAIAHSLGEQLGVGACTMSITRTRVGNFKIEDAVIFDKLL